MEYREIVEYILVPMYSEHDMGHNDCHVQENLRLGFQPFGNPLEWKNYNSPSGTSYIKCYVQPMVKYAKEIQK